VIARTHLLVMEEEDMAVQEEDEEAVEEEEAEHVSKYFDLVDFLLQYL
jgi:hypothetical protein